MGDFKYSLMWDAYNTNICKGLSLLQQHGEFVDMTLAADGHHVKVHKMVMSLVSPYIKDLISSADCPHPVIFLNQISYETLTAILEYVYTGQVTVDQDDLTKFMEACKALHIKGFEELNLYNKIYPKSLIHRKENTNISAAESIQEQESGEKRSPEVSPRLQPRGAPVKDQDEDTDADVSPDYLNMGPMDDDHHDDHDKNHDLKKQIVISNTTSLVDKKPSVQYSLSNHGHLQLVLNRFVYNRRYSARKNFGQHTWQCIDGHCKGKKCPARVVTYKDVVLSRTKLHNHPHHDKKILKKVQAGTIFTGLSEAESRMHLIRRDKDKTCDTSGN